MHTSPLSTTTSLMVSIDTQSRYSKKSPQRSQLSSPLVLIKFLLKFETCSLQAINELLSETCRRVDATREFMFISKNRDSCFCQQYSSYCSNISKTLGQSLDNFTCIQRSVEIGAAESPGRIRGLYIWLCNSSVVNSVFLRRHLRWSITRLVHESSGKFPEDGNGEAHSPQDQGEMHADCHQIVSSFRKFPDLKVGSVEVVTSKLAPTSLDNRHVCGCSDRRRENTEIGNHTNTKKPGYPGLGGNGLWTWNWRQGIRCTRFPELLQTVHIQVREN